MLVGRLFSGAAALAMVSGAARAEVVRVEVSAQKDWAGGQAFSTGLYEIVSGTVWYEIDASAPEARDIADIRLAPRNARGKVEYHGPFLILRPKAAGSANGTMIFEVANRGGEQTNLILFHADKLGSGLIGHSQKMTVAASATAEKKTVGQRS